MVWQREEKGKKRGRKGKEERKKGEEEREDVGMARLLARVTASQSVLIGKQKKKKKKKEKCSLIDSLLLRLDFRFATFHFGDACIARTN